MSSQRGEYCVTVYPMDCKIGVIKGKSSSINTFACLVGESDHRGAPDCGLASAVGPAAPAPLQGEGEGRAAAGSPLEVALLASAGSVRTSRLHMASSESATPPCESGGSSPYESVTMTR